VAAETNSPGGCIVQADELVGKVYSPFTVDVEKGRLRLFAKAIGETNPIYFDEDTARKAGYSSLPAPPTFGFSIAMDAEQPFMILEDLGVDKTRSMHGEQVFDYVEPICAGDTITGVQRVVETFEKKGGAMRFIVTETQLKNQYSRPVANLRTVIIVRQG
jgi:acyl dehydratase